MNKLLLLFLLPLFAFGFSATNLPTYINVQAVQPMDGLNLASTLDNDTYVVTNGHCAMHVTFNSEPTQLPRMCFRYFGPRVSEIVQPDTSTYPTNTNLDGYFSYTFYCPAPGLPEGTRVCFRRQVYFGGPPGSSFGLDCSGIAVIDVANGVIWLPKSNTVHRLFDADFNPVDDTFKGGFNSMPPALMMLSAPTE